MLIIMIVSVVAGSRLIETAPSNQSQLIGTNIRMPCKPSLELLNQRGLTIEWSKNVSLEYSSKWAAVRR